MEENRLLLADSMGNSISDDVHDILENFGEVGFDSLLDDGLFKEIPLISTAVSVYKIGSTLREKHNIAKLASFIKQINEQSIEKEKKEQHLAAIQCDRKKRESELEYLMVILDRYIHFDQSRYLAKVYLAYLNGRIDWLNVCKYSEVIDRFLPGDYAVLKSADRYRTENDINTDAIQRLIAQGLVIEGFRSDFKQDSRGGLLIDSNFTLTRKERNYSRTDFGNTLVEILEQ